MREGSIAPSFFMGIKTISSSYTDKSYFDFEYENAMYVYSHKYSQISKNSFIKLIIVP